jgi:hypothetical protein
MTIEISPVIEELEAIEAPQTDMGFLDLPRPITEVK